MAKLRIVKSHNYIVQEFQEWNDKWSEPNMLMTFATLSEAEQFCEKVITNSKNRKNCPDVIKEYEF